LKQPDGIPEAQWRLIASHFKRLRLIDRYNELGNDEIAEMLSVSNAYQEAEGPDVQTFLRNMAIDRRAVYGRNHWVALLMNALAGHPDLQSWIDAT
jgi:hypothetical protein